MYNICINIINRLVSLLQMLKRGLEQWSLALSPSSNHYLHLPTLKSTHIYVT